DHSLRRSSDLAFGLLDLFQPGQFLLRLIQIHLDGLLIVTALFLSFLVIGCRSSVFFLSGSIGILCLGLRLKLGFQSLLCLGQRRLGLGNCRVILCLSLGKGFLISLIRLLPDSLCLSIKGLGFFCFSLGLQLLGLIGQILSLTVGIFFLLPCLGRTAVIVALGLVLGILAVIYGLVIITLGLS